jgi:hypothetical protein
MVYTTAQSGTSFCIYSAKRTIRTSLSHDQIRAYYGRVYFDGIGERSQRIELPGDGEPGKLRAYPSFDDADPEIAIIELEDGGYYGRFVSLDFRCWSGAGP